MLTHSISSIISSFIYFKFSGIYVCKERNELFELETHEICINDDGTFQWKHQCVLNEDIISQSWNRCGTFDMRSTNKMILLCKSNGIQTRATAYVRANKYGQNGILEIRDNIDVNIVWLTLKQQ